RPGRGNDPADRAARGWIKIHATASARRNAEPSAGVTAGPTAGAARRREDVAAQSLEPGVGADVAAGEARPDADPPLVGSLYADLPHHVNAAADGVHRALRAVRVAGDVATVGVAKPVPRGQDAWREPGDRVIHDDIAGGVDDVVFRQEPRHADGGGGARRRA